MIIIDYLDILDKYACDYCKEDVELSVLRNRHMNDLQEDDKIPKKISDAIIVDFINYVGFRFGGDYGMYTRDLKKKEKNDSKRTKKETK